MYHTYTCTHPVMPPRYPPIPNTYSKDLQQMVRDCLDPLPEKRPTMDRILGLPAINSRLHLLERGAIHPPSTAQSNLIETIKVCGVLHSGRVCIMQSVKAPYGSPLMGSCWRALAVRLSLGSWPAMMI
jgi:hypothetical protein